MTGCFLWMNRFHGLSRLEQTEMVKTFKKLCDIQNIPILRDAELNENQERTRKISAVTRYLMVISTRWEKLPGPDSKLPPPEPVPFKNEMPRWKAEVEQALENLGF